VGVVVGVAVGTTEAVAVGVGVTVGVVRGVEVGVEPGVAEGIELAVGVGVSPCPCTSNDPTSIRPFTTRSNPVPRWSNEGSGVKLGSPPLSARLPGNNACVNVGPPLFWSRPSRGSVNT
jgi:hypothetical protein